MQKLLKSVGQAESRPSKPPCLKEFNCFEQLGSLDRTSAQRKPRELDCLPKLIPGPERSTMDHHRKLCAVARPVPRRGVPTHPGCMEAVRVGLA